MASAAVDRLLADVAREVNALPPIARRHMAPVLVQARRETAQGLSRWLQSANDADERFTAQQYRGVLVQLDQAFSTVAELEPSTLHGLKLAGLHAANLALSHVHLELATFAKMFGAPPPIALRVAATIQEGQRTLMTRFASSAARYAGAVGDDIRRELAVGMVRGESIRQMAQRLVRHGGPRVQVTAEAIATAPGAVSEQAAVGLFQRYNWWADRLARTEVINAYNVHSDEEIAAANKVDPRIERMWSGVEDRRECPICRDLDGRTAPIGGMFPGGYDAPPAHPQCRCALVAWRSDWSMKEAA